MVHAGSQSAEAEVGDEAVLAMHRPLRREYFLDPLSLARSQAAARRGGEAGLPGVLVRDSTKAGLPWCRGSSRRVVLGRRSRLVEVFSLLLLVPAAAALIVGLSVFSRGGLSPAALLFGSLCVVCAVGIPMTIFIMGRSFERYVVVRRRSGESAGGSLVSTMIKHDLIGRRSSDEHDGLPGLSVGGPIAVVHAGRVLRDRHLVVAFLGDACEILEWFESSADAAELLDRVQDEFDEAVDRLGGS